MSAEMWEKPKSRVHGRSQTCPSKGGGSELAQRINFATLGWPKGAVNSGATRDDCFPRSNNQILRCARIDHTPVVAMFAPSPGLPRPPPPAVERGWECHADGSDVRRNPDRARHFPGSTAEKCPPPKRHRSQRHGALSRIPSWLRGGSTRGRASISGKGRSRVAWSTRAQKNSCPLLSADSNNILCARVDEHPLATPPAAKFEPSGGCSIESRESRPYCTHTHTRTKPSTRSGATPRHGGLRRNKFVLLLWTKQEAEQRVHNRRPRGFEEAARTDAAEKQEATLFATHGK